MGVSINGGTLKMMVYNGQSENNMDDKWGYHHFRKPPIWELWHQFFLFPNDSNEPT